MTCTGTYTIDQADMDNGRKNNTGGVTSLSPTGNLVGDTNDDVVQLAGTASITLGEKMSGVAFCQEIVVHGICPRRRGSDQEPCPALSLLADMCQVFSLLHTGQLYRSRV